VSGIAKEENWEKKRKEIVTKELETN